MVIGGISIVLIPLVIVGAVTFIKSFQTLEEISKVRSAQIAHGLASMIQINISRELKIVSALAEDHQIVESVSRGKYSIIDRKLRDLFLKIGTEYEGLAILDKDGNVRSEGVDKKRIGINLIERDYFQAARNGKTYIGTPVISKASGKPIIGVCAPVWSNNGKFMGAALAVVKIDFLINLMTYTKVGKTGYPLRCKQKYCRLNFSRCHEQRKDQALFLRLAVCL
jgi:methyl-accepting chemotaxis protein